MSAGRVAGLSELAASYDGVLCDIWGVLHNGVEAFPGAIDALQRFRKERGPVVLVTNAPRPAGPIMEQLRVLRVPQGTFDGLVTSGDVTRSVLAERPGACVFHIGPDRDLSFYDDLDVVLTGEEQAELISCTGLFDDTRETPDDYQALLERLAARNLPMVCANPDIVVERGNVLVYCAGAIARLYEDIGGEVILVGKPHAPIYASAKKMLAELGASRILAIGDGLPMALGAAVACPDRPVVALQADGSAMYTIQALWTQAREGLDVTTVVCDNGAYAILTGELENVGATSGGERARRLLDLGSPALDFVALATGMGVPATRATTAEELADQLRRALAEPGPHLIDAVLPGRE